MSDFTFITGNQHKVDYLAKWLGSEITHHKLDLDEVQSLDLKTVAEHKARQAYEVVGTPVLVEDVALTFTAMGRLPGTLIKWFLHELDTEGLARLAQAQQHQKAVASICYSYYDGDRLEFFEHHIDGQIADKPRGGGFGWNPIFIPNGASKTYAEMTDEEVRPHSMRAQAVEEFRAFISTKLKE